MLIGKGMAKVGNEARGAEERRRERAKGETAFGDEVRRDARYCCCDGDMIFESKSESRKFCCRADDVKEEEEEEEEDVEESEAIAAAVSRRVVVVDFGANATVDFEAMTDD